VPPPTLRDRIRGCLLGGAVGDALGAPVEFLTLAQIRTQYGREGVTKLEESYGRVGAVTDDTQMTLFTAEGLIRAWVRGETRGIGHPPSCVHHAYLRWLHTQGVPWQRAARAMQPTRDCRPDGWLIGERWLHARRAPGNTCLSALERALHLGDPAQNDSKGCGGVMRAAPAGLVPTGMGGHWPADPASDDAYADSVEAVFDLAAECAALTHGHPTGQLPAGVLAATVHALLRGKKLPRAIEEATRVLQRKPKNDETLAALEAAHELAQRGDPTPEQLETLGGGWIAEEALAIALCAALVHPDDMRAALLLAANHSGDTDSTAAIAGNLLGAALGESAIPSDWLDQLEGRDTIEQLADDLHVQMTDRAPKSHDGWGGFSEAWYDRYPGW